ncbi:MAG: hypothetical protein NWE99_06020 [Candidatus Bathyarchaeota archaeon]|nr:hypothetical protein [Candidatus Bathyarchaeota archaeon]
MFKNMFKNMNFRDKIAFSGITVLGIGITLLIFTFISAFGFLGEGWQILSTQDLVQTFGEALGPLIATSIRVMYLGVMGWIGSLITIRGVTIMNNAPKAELGSPQPQTPQQKLEPQPQRATAKPEKEAKPGELEMMVIPLEEMEQKQST